MNPGEEASERPMSVIPGYDYDMFVSYAHLDNPVLGPGSGGWVDTLVKKLEGEVKARGIKGFTAWFDKNLTENLPLTPQLMEKIKKSATLLVVMSPCYLQSEWCKREREGFLSLVDDRVAEGCVFVVEARQVSHSDYPDVFHDLVPLAFWVEDPESRTDRPLGMPNPNEEQYYTRICRLSYLIKEQMERLRSRSTPVGALAPTASNGGATVFIARATEDLEDREDELRSYLMQLGIAVLPQTRYPQTNAEAFEAAMLEDLRKSKLYVQLLSASRGRELDFLPGKRHPCLQHDIAQKAGKPIFLWRDRSLDLHSVKDPDHLGLLESARACGIEEFKRAVADEARKQPPPPRPSANVMVFVNADRRDRDLAKQIGAELKKKGVECFYPLECGTAEEVRKDWEDTLRDCDGVLLIYGTAGADWIRWQLRQSTKIIRLREHPLKGLAVLEGPPPDKSDLGADIPDLITLDCRKGIDLSILQNFAESLLR